MHTTFTIQTSGAGLYEFTRQVVDWVTGDGLLTLLVQHTSASLLIQENADPEVQTDMQNFFHRLVPPTTDPKMAYLTHTYEGPDDMPPISRRRCCPSTCQFLSKMAKCGWEHGKGFTFSNIAPPHTNAMSQHIWGNII